MNFACSEGCFQAMTAESCFQYLAISNGNEATKQLLSSLTERICKGSTGVELQTRLADLGPLNLFVLTSGEYPTNCRIDTCDNPT